jgi:hypothetical protein
MTSSGRKFQKTRRLFFIASRCGVHTLAAKLPARCCVVLQTAPAVIIDVFSAVIAMLRAPG